MIWTNFEVMMLSEKSWSQKTVHMCDSIAMKCPH